MTNEDILKLAHRISALENAIRKHRDMAWDDRCLEDDRALYSILDEPIPDFVLPPVDDMFESCRRYIAQHGCPVAELPPGKMTIGQLEQKVSQLESTIASYENEGFFFQG